MLDKMPGDVVAEVRDAARALRLHVRASRQEAAVHGRRVRPVARVEPRRAASTGTCSTSRCTPALRRWVQDLNRHLPARAGRCTRCDFEPARLPLDRLQRQREQRRLDHPHARDRRDFVVMVVQLHAGAARRLPHRRARGRLVCRAAQQRRARSTAAATSATAAASRPSRSPRTASTSRSASPSRRSACLLPQEALSTSLQSRRHEDHARRPQVFVLRDLRAFVIDCRSVMSRARASPSPSSPSRPSPTSSPTRSAVPVLPDLSAPAGRVADDDRPAVRLVRRDAAGGVGADGRGLRSHRPQAAAGRRPARARAASTLLFAFADSAAVAVCRAPGAGRRRRASPGSSASR